MGRSASRRTPLAPTVDTSYGANAAIGAFSSYSQVSKHLEAFTISRTTPMCRTMESGRKLTLDFGVRFVNQRPYYDARKQQSNFLPDQWTPSSALALYIAGCAMACTPALARTVRRRIRSRSVSDQTRRLPSARWCRIRQRQQRAGTRARDRRHWYSGRRSPPRRAWIRLRRHGQADPRYLRRRRSLRPAGANAAGTYNMIGNPPITQTATVRKHQLQS